MPLKPMLIALEFVQVQSITDHSQAEEHEVNATWSGTPDSPYPSKTYAGLLSTSKAVGLRDDDGTALIKWTFRGIPVTAEFMVPPDSRSDTGTAAAKRTAELILKAAYLGCGYQLMFPIGQASGASR